MLYSIYRATKRMPIIGPLANNFLRRTRNLFWSLRPAPVQNGGELPADYLGFIESGLDEFPFKLVEVGAGDGRVLRHLAQRYPGAHFIGVDIQKAAIAEGNRILAKENISNVRLFCASCLEDTLDWNCDYLISRTALIYLNQSEIEVFLHKRLPQVRRALLLQEIVSVTGKTEVSHFFANPLVELAHDAGGGHFAASARLLDYLPWKQDLCWSGADITIRRILPAAANSRFPEPPR